MNSLLQRNVQHQQIRLQHAIQMLLVTSIWYNALTGIQKSYLITCNRNETTEYYYISRSFMRIRWCVQLRKNVGLY